MTIQAQLLPGTLDLLILRAVSLGPMHGYGVLLRIEQISGHALLIEQGALYPGLFRLVRQGLSRQAGARPRTIVALSSRTHHGGPQTFARGNRGLESSRSCHRFRPRRAAGGSMKL